MAVPDGLTIECNRDRDHRIERWARTGLVSVLCVVCGAGLLSVFGQVPSETVVSAERAKLTVRAPLSVRGGLLYEARIAIEARDALRAASLRLDEGWTEGMTINTIEPSPIREGSADGALALAFGHVPIDGRLVVYLQFQVNPTTVGRRSQAVELYDGSQLVARVNRTVTVYP